MNWQQVGSLVPTKSPQQSYRRGFVPQSNDIHLFDRPVLFDAACITLAKP